MHHPALVMQSFDLYGDGGCQCDSGVFQSLSRGCSSAPSRRLLNPARFPTAFVANPSNQPRLVAADIQSKMSTSFTPNCTLPPPGTNYVSTPPVRGTLDILWSCLSIFVLCTWSIHHPPVPVQACPQNRKQRLRKQWHIFRRKLVFAINMLFIPEWVLSIALSEFLSALESTRHAEKHGEDLTMADSFYLDMGGFAIDFDKVISASEDVEMRDLAPEQPTPRVSIGPGRTSQDGSDIRRRYSTEPSFD